MNDHQSSKVISSRATWLSGLIIASLVLGAIVLIIVVRGKRLPTMDRALFETAYSRWNENKLIDYDITVVVSGRQPGEYVVQVRDGIATASTMNGRSLTQRRTFGTWTVDGMFDTLQRDLDTNDERNNLMLAAEFDETHGFPRRYKRLEMQSGINDSLRWEVTEFESLSSQDPSNGDVLRSSESL